MYLFQTHDQSILHNQEKTLTYSYSLQSGRTINALQQSKCV